MKIHTNMLRRLFARHRPPALGRWAVTHSAQDVQLKADLASHDHCGSELCVHPPTKTIITKEEADADLELAVYPFTGLGGYPTRLREYPTRHRPLTIVKDKVSAKDLEEYFYPFTL